MTDRTDRSNRRPARALVGVVAGALVAVLAAGFVIARVASPEPGPAETLAAPNPATPGSFRGYGFDQCLTPSQSTMDTWLEHSPFLAVGVYLSGNSRHCRNQPNLTASWVATQLSKGWKILPITLGPQASCATRYPKYGASIDPTIDPRPGNWYAAAKAQGKLEAERAVSAAQAIGIVKGSTLFYDLEAFDISKTYCRESAIRFVHQWTIRLHELGYLSGYYSSAGSGIKMLDQARQEYPGVFTMPDTLWIARWDGAANTTISTDYLSRTAWTPHRRVKQYMGGHNETWGSVTVNIDRNFVDVGAGSVAPAETLCPGVRSDLVRYMPLSTTMPRTVTNKNRTLALQCHLQVAGFYPHKPTGVYGVGTQRAIMNWQKANGWPVTTSWSVGNWMALLSGPRNRTVKYGSTGAEVRRAQRALQAAYPAYNLTVTGVFDQATQAAVKDYRKRTGLTGAPVVNANVWWRFRIGKR